MQFDSLPLDIKKIIWSFTIGNLSFPTLNLFLVCKEWTENFQIIFNRVCENISTDIFTGLWFILKCCLINSSFFSLYCKDIDTKRSHTIMDVEYEDPMYFESHTNIYTRKFFKKDYIGTKYIIRNNYYELTYILANILTIDLGELDITMILSHGRTEIEDYLYELIKKYNGYEMNEWVDGYIVEDISIRVLIKEFDKNNIIKLLNILKK